jgi:transcriptional regulator with XRE-family HTH domain
MKKGKPGPRWGKKRGQAGRTQLGDRLYKCRKAHGLTQEQLGEIIGVSKRMVSHYEAGSLAMTVESLQKFAKALGVKTSYLLGERGSSPIIEEKSKIKPSLSKRIEMLKKLKPIEQQSIFRSIDNAWKNQQSGDETKAKPE